MTPVRPTAPILAAALLVPAVAAGQVLVEIRHPEPSATEVRGFELGSEQEIEIEATVLGSHPKIGPLSSAWILDSADRDEVWRVPESGKESAHQETAKIRLPAGTYEAYFATSPMFEHLEWLGDESWWAKAARMLLGRGHDWREALDEAQLVIRGRGKSLSEDVVAERRERFRKAALVSLDADRNRFSRALGFALERPAEIEVYAVGELTREGAYDYGWILDAKTRQKVWTFDFADSEETGVNTKNRMARRVLRLPAGKYAAYFVTDGSHSPGDWNCLPPADPAYWGLTVTVRDPEARRWAKAVDYQEVPDDALLITRLTRLHDDEYRTQGLRLSAPLDVRVVAEGEATHEEMADYGWILDAKTRQKVWVMTYERTTHAGGASKNRLVDEVVHLDAGSYIVGFVTDDSHSYRDWNATPPTQPEWWGISLYGIEGQYDPEVVKKGLDPEAEADVLARIDRVRDDRREVRRFVLDRESKVAVYALGEGSGGEMYDYGWIARAGDERTVWTMSYKLTEPAGGATKNRLFQGTLTLPAGEYELHYQTDGSHAFGDWNAPPPYDPEAWGIQIARVR